MDNPRMSAMSLMHNDISVDENKTMIFFGSFVKVSRSFYNNMFIVCPMELTTKRVSIGHSSSDYTSDLALKENKELLPSTFHR